MIKETDVTDNSHGNVLLRLLSYLKPYWHQMLIAFILVLCITGFELYRPILIGDAIDQYINGYNKPYAVVEKDSKNSIAYDNYYISKDFDTHKVSKYLQIVLYKDNYYLFKSLTLTEQQYISNSVNNNNILNFRLRSNKISIQKDTKELQGTRLTSSELKQLRTSDFSGIKLAAMIYLIVLLFSFLFNMIQTWILQLLGQNIVYNIRKEIYEHIHSLSLRFFDINPVGRIVTRITNDVEALSEMFSTIIIKLFKNSIKIIGLAIVMIRIDLKMALFSFLLMPFIVLLTFIFKKISRATYRVTRTKLTIINTFLSENISGMKLIQIFAREKEKYKEFETKNKEVYKAFFREMMVFAIFRPSIYMLSVISLVIIIGIGGSSVLHGALTMGTLFIFIQYINSFFDPIQELAEQFGTLQSSLASAEKIFTILDEEPMILEKEEPIHLPDIKGKIEFKNVWFAYEGEEYILKDVSFTILPGEKVAFVGATGAGKSSILNLIGRYYDIQKGEILIDGINIKELSKNELRSSIGQVQQDVFIFTGDIKSNISLNREDITMEEIEKACEHVNASPFIHNLPNRFDEPVSERGATFSAGQRQLLSFARTLAYKPNILVMDEATANIDTETETLIQDALEKLMDGRTTIMVAHRLSTIQHADNIIVMHKGRIRESGTHQELLIQNGIYKKLYELQLNS
ncbi:ABC transporter ATP-binding protein [Anaeromicropila herbilytica]|uniref:Lipid A ABC transporter permease/ATP-binding protein n=1 Tax=Anaeromicropila herbilytica TaxID=2785025 RepID=A0A7R7ELW1_9FIRM|nr:ABC transporter ATP-binding protein [Anaeromicropila herbilytica]BCN31224.1 lipid A ABC transporter permease/ATP-binding protein [Anaeromicropila herbilytica]